jgi:hypothetical protein
MTRTLELPVALVAGALLLFLAFQTVELVRDSQNLVAIARSQDTPLQETARLKQAVDSLAGELAQLAQEGDANAKQVVDEMAKQNIRLQAAQPATEPAR